MSPGFAGCRVLAARGYRTARQRCLIAAGLNLHCGRAAGRVMGHHMITYRGYRIEPFEPEIGRWRARISRLDGKKIKVAIPPSEQAFLDTTDTESYEYAVKLAKQGIDGGGMN